MVVAEAVFLLGVYKTLKSTHEFVKDFNENVLRNAKIKGILEIKPEDVRQIEEQLRVVERVQDELEAEHRWRVRQREAITKRRDGATDATERARRATDLEILERKLKAIEGTMEALNQKEATLHNIDAVLKKAEALGSKKAAKLRKAGEVSTKELDEVGIDIAALSSKLDEDHKASESVLRWLEKESAAA